MIGFILGATLGMGINYAGLAIYNFSCKWLECPNMTIEWWDVILIPLLIGFAMVINIANYPHGD